MKNLISIQDEYIDTMTAGWARWSTDGHMPRISRGAFKRARRQLEKLGFSTESARQAIKDAHDVATLKMVAEDD